MNRTLIALALALLSACGGGGTGAPIEPVAVVHVRPAPEPAPAIEPAQEPVQPGIAPSAQLLAELTDGLRATDVLPLSAYTEAVVLPTSAIDLTIDRRLLLKELFARVTEGAADPVIAWVTYLQERIAHPVYPPIHDNGLAIFDPLWILQNRIAHCGQTNRLLVDGLLAAGHEARVVQLRNHQAAEVWLDGQWRYVDADWMTAFVRNADGSIASAQEIRDDPSLLDGLDAGEEFKRYPVEVLPPGFGSYADMFSVGLSYYIKTATPEQERDPYFGWASYYKTVE